MSFRKGVRLKAEQDWGIQTHAPGLARYSGQSMNTREQAETETAIKSVALSQPGRNGSDSKLLESPLGRFCLRTHARDERLAERRFWAGCDYAKLIDNDLVARGLVPRHYGRGEMVQTGHLTSEQLLARRDLARINLAKADECLIEVHGLRAVSITRKVAHEDREPGLSDGGILFHCLYNLAMYFGYENRPYHERGVG